MTYTATATRTLALIKRKGGTVTFHRADTAYYDANTDRYLLALTTQDGSTLITTQDGATVLLAH